MSADPADFAVIGKGWEFTPSELDKLDPRKLVQSFRSALNRAGASEADGYLIAAIHGEFDGTLFRLHFHGLAAGGMIRVLDRLRKRPGYRSQRSEREEQRVRIGRKPLANLPYPLTYIFQSSWPYRWRGEIDGVAKRGNIRHRIPEPHHTQLLLWLDRWELEDLTLLMGVSVNRRGLTRTRKSYRNERTAHW